MHQIDVKVDYTVIIALLLFSAMVSSVLCVYIYTKSRSGKVMKYFITGQMLTIIWTVFYIFELLAPTANIRWYIVVFEYIPLCFVGFVFMQFSYAYTNHQPMNSRLFYTLLIPPIIGYISVLTNEWHHLFYKSFDINGEVFGPFTYFIIFVTMAYLISGAILFLNKKNLKTISRQKQSMYFIIAIIVPVVVHTVYLLGYLRFGFSITLVFIPFSVLLFIVSVLKYQFLDILPIAVKDTIEGMADGMLVVHNNGNIVDYNTDFFKKCFGVTNMKNFKTIFEFNRKLKDIVMEYSDLDSLYVGLQDREKDVQKGTIKINTYSNRMMVVQYTVKPICDYNSKKIATLITFFDMSDIYELYQILETKNRELINANMLLQNHIDTVQKLATETERNKIMSEIHDTLGHSMMELLTILEVADLVIEQENGTVMDAIDDAILKARTSLKEIRSAVSRYKKMGGLS